MPPRRRWDSAAVANVSRRRPLSPYAHWSILRALGVLGLRTTFDKFGEETLIPPSQLNAAGVYLFEQSEGKAVNISFGGRYDYRHLDVDADTVLGNAAKTHTWNSVIGNVGLLFHLSEPAALVINVGRGFRAPSSFDLYSNGVHEGTVAFERGNPNLKTETSINTDVALRAQTSQVSFELGTYLNLIQDYIYSIPTGTTDTASGFQIYDVVQGDARLTGLEGALQWHPTPYLHLQGTADYVNGENTTTNNPLPNMPPFRRRGRHSSGGRTLVERSEPLPLRGRGDERQADPPGSAEAQFYTDAFGERGYQSQSYTIR